VSETTSTTVYNEKLQSVRPDWVPLVRGPFEFRNVINGGVVRPGTADRDLCEWIMHPHPQLKIGGIVRSVRLDRNSAKIELTFNNTNQNSQTGLYLPAKEEFEELLAVNAEIRGIHTAVRKTWSAMKQQFYTAVRCGACIVVARRGAYDAARFTQIPCGHFSSS
jgi:hypothetical protein